MSDDQDKIFSQINSMALTTQERQVMRDRLKAYALSYAPKANIATSFWSFVSRHAIASLVVLVLLLAGGTTTLAGNSRPGDFLYPVRTRVNDKLSSAAAYSEDGKMDVELSQIDREINDENFVMDKMIKEEQDGIAQENADIEKQLNNDGEMQRLEREMNQIDKDLNDEQDAQADL
jgi:hypothetical protein